MRNSYLLSHFEKKLFFKKYSLWLIDKITNKIIFAGSISELFGMKI